MNTKGIVQKLWNLCNVLRDEGITYHQYVTELTYILFLKMMKETGQEDTDRRDGIEGKKIPEDCRWDELIKESGSNLLNKYKNILAKLGEDGEDKIKKIYNKAVTNIEEPKNLEKIIKDIDNLDWYSAKEEGLGDLYEGLLQKNAEEKKSGAGQYFTPRVLIDVIVRCVEPREGEYCNDPAAGTFGFMIAVDRYIKERTNNNINLSKKERDFQIKKAFTGNELVSDTHRLALMNAMLHDIDSDINCVDTLSNKGEIKELYNVVLSNPPFGTKKGGERPARKDFPVSTSNKQLNFLQHIYLSLKADGKARAAVVLPDNVLFQEGEGAKVRQDLLAKCNLHTILRLPTGIFYAQGVKTNVFFFTRGKSGKDNTKGIWFYDLRTNMPSFGKTNQLKANHFKEFEDTFKAEKRIKQKIERWSYFSIQDIEAKNYDLDLGLIKDENVVDYDQLPDPIESTEDVVAKLEQAVDLLQSIIKELHMCEVKK